MLTVVVVMECYIILSLKRRVTSYITVFNFFVRNKGMLSINKLVTIRANNANCELFKKFD